MSLNKIKKAIKEMKTLSFYYKDDDGASGFRIRVQPVAYGISQADKFVLRAWVKPPSTSYSGLKAKGEWRLFLISKMGAIKLHNKGWRVDKPGLNKQGDEGMKKVYLHIKNKKDKNDITSKSSKK